MSYIVKSTGYNIICSQEFHTLMTSLQAYVINNCMACVQCAGYITIVVFHCVTDSHTP